MLEKELKKIQVGTGKKITDDEVYLRIEDQYSITGVLNLCWLNEEETEKLIGYLQESKRRLEEKRIKLKEIISTTDFSKMYIEFESKYNKYPVTMAPYEAFGCAHKDNLIDDDTYYAASKYYGKMWNYVGD